MTKGAREIQMNIVPKIFPPFPDNPNVELYAFIEPARNVGGDLYDFFFLNKNRFCFLVGDVSDKGIPASLFMAVTITLMRTKASENISPDQLLFEVNNALCQKNDSLMFVTMFCGIIDLDTGEITYANGGHNPPYLICTDDKLIQIPLGKGMALGVMENTKFEPRSITLKSGQGLFLYTDGINEAENSRGEGFG
jgi:sigma-B regulation protein RsbU (phosphoserine phosphatase)